MRQAGSPAHQARVEVGTRDVCGGLGRPVENSRATRVLVRPVVVEHLADPLCWQRSFQRQARHHAALTANTSIQTVRDTGIDIAGEDPARLFAPGGAFRAASGASRWRCVPWSFAGHAGRQLLHAGSAVRNPFPPACRMAATGRGHRRPAAFATAETGGAAGGMSQRVKDINVNEINSLGPT
jgi:hypothetical protein